MKLIVLVSSFLTPEQWVTIIRRNPPRWEEIVKLIRWIERQYGSLIIPDILRVMALDDSMSEEFAASFEETTMQFLD